MNTSPTISLPWDQVVARENDRWLSIATWKERAGGTLLEEELVVSRPGEPTSAGAALLALRQMAARHDSFIGADVKHKSHVFAHASGHAGDAEHPRFRSLTTVSFKTAFDTVSLAAFGQRPVPAPSSARASLLMVVRGHSPSIRKTQLTAGHKRADTTLRHYAGKARAAHHIDHMTAIRDFQKRLEQIAMHNMLPNRLLAEEEAYATRLHDAIRTGLGVLCIRPPPSEEPDPLDGCASIEKCPNCTNVRLATTPEELADLIAFGEHLAEHEDWLQSHRPEAWMTRWLYWSLLIDEVIKRGARSVWAPNLKRAREIHASRPKPRFPPLW